MRFQAGVSAEKLTLVLADCPIGVFLHLFRAFRPAAVRGVLTPEFLAFPELFKVAAGAETELAAVVA